MQGPARKTLTVAEQGLRDLGLGEVLRERLRRAGGCGLVRLVRAVAGAGLAADRGTGSERSHSGEGGNEGDAYT
ncbi:hypothetical protein [Streptomyces sp. NPDC059753]|uniref:hypothetical protein n=1 Tax=Streptomyces sp. NPDC059753 TaxID=3346933 RepID=UPI00364DBF45